MNAETFFKKLDEIRSAARSEFGMKQHAVVFDSNPVQQLIKFVEGLYREGEKKYQEPGQIAPPSPPLTTDHVPERIETQPRTSAPVPAGDGPMTSNVLPRDPRPVHPIDVVEATKDTVITPDGGWQDGDS